MRSLEAERLHRDSRPHWELQPEVERFWGGRAHLIPGKLKIKVADEEYTTKTAAAADFKESRRAVLELAGLDEDVIRLPEIPLRFDIVSGQGSSAKATRGLKTLPWGATAWQIQIWSPRDGSWAPFPFKITAKVRSEETFKAFEKIMGDAARLEPQTIAEDSLKPSFLRPFKSTFRVKGRLILTPRMAGARTVITLPDSEVARVFTEGTVEVDRAIEVDFGAWGARSADEVLFRWRRPGQEWVAIEDAGCREWVYNVCTPPAQDYASITRCSVARRRAAKVRSMYCTGPIIQAQRTGNCGYDAAAQQIPSLFSDAIQVRKMLLMYLNLKGPQDFHWKPADHCVVAWALRKPWVWEPVSTTKGGRVSEPLVVDSQ